MSSTGTEAISPIWRSREPRAGGALASVVTGLSNCRSPSAIGCNVERLTAREIRTHPPQRGHHNCAILVAHALKRDLVGLVRERLELVEQLLSLLGQEQPPRAAIGR